MLLKLSEKVSLSTEDYVNIFSVPNFVSPDYAGLACVAGVWGARETRGAREEETIVFAIPPTNYVCKITQLWMTSCQISLAAMHLFKSHFKYCFSFVFLQQEIWSEGTIKKSVNAVVRWKKKVAAMRGLLYKIQHKSITFLLKVWLWTSQLACSVCRRN